MNVESVAQWILKNPTSYPGKHHASNPRTTEACKPLEPKAQFVIIWRAFIEYLNETLRAGRSVHIKNFGSFTFDIQTELPRIATKSITPTQDLLDQRLERKHLHSLRPCFVVDPNLQAHLIHYHGKEEFSKPKSQNSIFQKGFAMIYCNPVPIAASCYLGKAVVQEALDQFFHAIIDLVKYGRDIELRFGFANVHIQNKTLKAVFKPEFKTLVNDKKYESKMKKSEVPASTAWKTTYNQSWGKSTLSTLMKRPQSPLVKTMGEKTMALKIMSLDMASAGLSPTNFRTTTDFYRTDRSKRLSM